jgi:hypothetical protein
MRPFEDAMASELAGLLRAGVPARGVHLTVRDLLVARIERGSIGASEITEAVEGMVRAACRLARERDAPAEMIETVCRATLEAVRGQGGASSRWFVEATSATYSVLDELARDHANEPGWRWVARRLTPL